MEDLKLLSSPSSWSIVLGLAFLAVLACSILIRNKSAHSLPGPEPLGPLRNTLEVGEENEAHKGLCDPHHHAFASACG